MMPDKIVDYIRELAAATADVAAEKTTKTRSKARLNMQASVLYDAVDLILQLQDRLARQAHAYEHIEAYTSSMKTWPLLRDDGADCGL